MKRIAWRNCCLTTSALRQLHDIALCTSSTIGANIHSKTTTVPARDNQLPPRRPTTIPLLVEQDADQVRPSHPTTPYTKQRLT